MQDDVKDAGEPTMKDGPPVDNISGSVRTVGSTVRHTERGAGGKFKAREPRIVGPLNMPAGSGGCDSVTGEFRSGVRDNSQLFDMERTHAVDSRQLRYEVPNYPAGTDPIRASHAGSAEVQAMANHAMTCPCIATGGAICNG
jgi:hypothetical protein